MTYKWSQYNLATECDDSVILTNLVYFNSFKTKKIQIFISIFLKIVLKD